MKTYVENINVGIAQFACNLNKYESNIRKARKFISEASEKNIQLLCLPEAFATSMDLVGIESISETIPGRTSDILCAEAKDKNICIVAGILEVYNEKYYSSAVFINNLGIIEGIYRRVHLFTLEKHYLSNGDSFKVFDTTLGKIGVIIGYDVNFPESCRHFFMQKVELIICPTLVPSEFAYVTKIAAKARATENCCYFAFASGKGDNQFAGFQYMGDSAIIGNPYFLEKEQFDFMEGDENIVTAENKDILIYSTLKLGRLRKMIDSNSTLNDLQKSTYRFYNQ